MESVKNYPIKQSTDNIHKYYINSKQKSNFLKQPQNRVFLGSNSGIYTNVDLYYSVWQPKGIEVTKAKAFIDVTICAWI